MGVRDVRGFYSKQVNRMSRGSISLRSGVAWEKLCSEKMKQLLYNGCAISVGSTAGGGRGQDIPTLISNMQIGWEAKNKGAFEGGGTTLYEVDGRLTVPNKYPLLQSLFGNHVPWGRVPAKGEMIEDDYLDVPADSLAKYYLNKGSTYVIVEDKGVYHTGIDLLNLGVPYITVCGMRLRTRVTKHKKNGVPTDVSTAIVFPRRNLESSKFCLFNRLPPALTVVGE